MNQNLHISFYGIDGFFVFLILLMPTVAYPMTGDHCFGLAITIGLFFSLAPIIMVGAAVIYAVLFYLTNWIRLLYILSSLIRSIFALMLIVATILCMHLLSSELSRSCFVSDTTYLKLSLFVVVMSLLAFLPLRFFKLVKL